MDCEESSSESPFDISDSSFSQTKSYFEALLEVYSVRAAKEYPPKWTAFDEDNTWYVAPQYT